MRYLRLAGTPELEKCSAAYRELVASTYVTETRLVEWNLAGETITFLYAIDGEYRRLEESLSGLPSVRSVSVSPVDEMTGYLLLVIDPTETSLGDRIFELFTAHDVVMLKPVTYTAEQITGEVVGEDAEIQALVDSLPDDVTVTVEKISGSIPRPGTVVQELSERQREALQTALEVGYYDQPRQGTLGDIADRLGCAPSTATEHLNKAEAKLARAAILPYS